VLAHQAGNVNFGGLSLLILFNPNITSIARLWPAGTSSVVVALLEATLVVGVVGSVAAVAYRFYRSSVSNVPELPWLATLGVATVSGSLLAILTTQAENIVAVLPLLLLAAPLLRRWGRRLYWTVSLAAFAEYLTLLTPLAFFYPLFDLLGPGTVRWANGRILPYALDQTPVPAGVFWIVLGVVAGLALVAVWILAGLRVWQVLRRCVAVADLPVRPTVDSRDGGPPPVRAWRRSRLGTRAGWTSTLAVLLVVAILALEVGVTAAVVAPPRSTLQVEVVSVTPLPQGVTTTIRLTAGTTPLSVHVGLLPGTERARGPVHVFADSSYADPNGSYTTTAEIAERVSLALSGSGHAMTVAMVNAGGLPTILAAGSPGTLVVLGGLVPDSVLSNSSTLLADWVSHGGTLIWAGGLLGGAEGHPGSGGFVSDPLGPEGQLDLVHFPLSDTAGPGPLLSEAPTLLAQAVGTTYNGTPSGANTTEAAAHGGIDLGWDSPAGETGGAPRSSLVYVPVGSGGVFFFGGSVWGSKRPPLDVPAANLALADDVALLVASGYVPAAGPSAYANLHLDPRESVTLRLTVPNGLAARGLVVLVTTPTVPTFLSFWSETLVPAPA
ncbi:MAG: hypothetical protein ACHQ16_02470, partial [Candidatus Lutacidiplasmatales archaeon]